MKVLFINRDKKEILIANVDNEDDATKAIKDFCCERDFNIPYMRCWQKDNRTFIDVGSHTELFAVER